MEIGRIRHFSRKKNVTFTLLLNRLIAYWYRCESGMELFKPIPADYWFTQNSLGVCPWDPPPSISLL